MTDVLALDPISVINHKHIPLLVVGSVAGPGARDDYPREQGPA